MSDLPLREKIKHALDDPGDIVGRRRRGSDPIESPTAWRLHAICQVLTDHGIDVDAAAPQDTTTEAGRPSMSEVLFFGVRWDAPQVDDARQVPTPVGEKCLRCLELIADGDRGLIRAVGRLVDGELQASAEPIHAECDLIGIMGHDVDVCHCTGYDTTSRAAAQLVWQRVGERRGRDLGIRADGRGDPA